VKSEWEKSDDTKTRLIEAAGEVFARRGFRAATVREICKLADAHVGAVNYHFRDKKGLYAAVLEYSHLLAIRKYPPDAGLKEGATAEEKLRAFIHSFLLRILADGFPAWHGKLMAQEIVDPTGAVDQMVEGSVRPLYGILAGIIRELLREEKPPDGEDSTRTFLCASSIVGQCLHHYVARHIMALLRPRGFDKTQIDLIVDHITKFSLGGIRALTTDS
jgi:TetR/AcrR family transcriptional regulator, regulator of cefoperazone and chloramphenicol sensitivity